MPINTDLLEERLQKLLGKRTTSNEQISQNYWKPTAEHRIRLVPHEPQFIERLIHYQIAQSPTICAKTYGDKCPICVMRKKLWDSGDVELSKKLKPALRILAPIIEIGADGSKSAPKWWTFSKKVYDQILEICKDSDYGDISDPDTGVDLDVVFKKAVDAQSYPSTSIKARRKSTKLAENKTELDTIISKVPDISTPSDRLSQDELTKIVEGWISAIEFNQPNGNVTPPPQLEEKTEEKTDNDIFDEINKVVNED